MQNFKKIKLKSTAVVWGVKIANISNLTYDLRICLKKNNMLLRIKILHEFHFCYNKVNPWIGEHEFQLRLKKKIHETINICKTIETVNKDGSVQNIY